MSSLEWRADAVVGPGGNPPQPACVLCFRYGKAVATVCQFGDLEEQGKPTYFVLEIASPHTGHVDVGEKPAAYQALDILEYWGFDEMGQHHGARLAGDRLVEGSYEPVDSDELADGVLQGYSEVLNLNLPWERSQLV